MTEDSRREPFRVVCEIRPPARPDLRLVHRQVSALAAVCDALLVPENAIGAPSISSLVIAQEITLSGASPIACLNARDRNVLGLQRDLLTAVATGTRELLFVGGDSMPDGSRSGLTVRSMIDRTRAFTDELGVGSMTVGVTSRLGPLPDWKCDADRLFVQASFSLESLLAWREATDFAGAVYAGVIVPPSASRARIWSAELPGIEVPADLVEALEADPLAGVTFACDLVAQIEASGAFEGVHLIPGVRYREVASHLTRNIPAGQVASSVR